MNNPVIDKNGNQWWYQNDIVHRDDGPAVEKANGDKEWWIDDDQYTEQEFLAEVNSSKELTVADIEKLLGHRVKVVK